MEEGAAIAGVGGLGEPKADKEGIQGEDDELKEEIHLNKEGGDVLGSTTMGHQLYLSAINY
ncbi:hypothetical protein TSUD_72640 [Trifolium subterraneum]|uniref:Uncharacterized protein n=1 Tax=Trifolium subterraneum TaxID=3900 RepID=A0A2Z6LKP4_TRISU|nr:hypothetical protein TSUD_72640 [Trifolium subterraneum]